MTGALAGFQVERYERDGFLFPVDAMAAGEAIAFRNRLEQAEKDYAAGNHDRPISHYLMGGGSHACPLASDPVSSSRHRLTRSRAFSGPESDGLERFVLHQGSR